jgi:hypothetical protein
MYFAPNYWTCTAAQILQLEGFLLAYGALVLKTWRFALLFLAFFVFNAIIQKLK